MRGGAFLVAGAIAGLVMTTSAFAQSGPSQGEISKQLWAPVEVIPVPGALQGGHQGLPTNGATARAASPSEIPNRTTRVSATVTSAQPVSPHRVAGLPPGCQADAAAATNRAVSFGNNLITFEFGSAELSPAATAQLQELGKALLENHGASKVSFLIQGHTDAVGTYAFNEDLSLQRAQAVKNFLVTQMHVPEDRLTVQGRSYCDPANASDPRGAENRRVVVINRSS